MAREVTTSYRNSTVRLWDSADVSLIETDYFDSGVGDYSGDGTDCKVVAAGTPDNTVIVSIGKVYINDVDDGLEEIHTERLFVRVARTLTVPANSTGNVRVDAVIARIDVDEEPDAQADNVGTVEIITGDGTSPLSDNDIQTEVGDDAWYRLADIETPDSFASITNSEIVDTRAFAQVKTLALSSLINGTLTSYIATGSGNNFDVTLPISINSATLPVGLKFSLKSNQTITGTATVTVTDGMGRVFSAVTIQKEGGGSPLVAGDLTTNMYFELEFDGTFFQLKTPSAIIPAVYASGMMMTFAGKTAPSGWLLCDGTAVSRTTYSNLFNAISPSLGTFTVTIASPGVFSKTTHGLELGDSIYFTTTGALPTGLSANTLYYVISAGLTADAFQVSATRGGAAVNTSGSQSGTHTLVYCPYGLGNGSTTFNVPDLRGRMILGKDNMGGSSANRVTHVNADTLGAPEGAETKDISHTHTSNAAHRSEGAGGGSIGKDYTEFSGEFTTSGMSQNSNPNVMNPYMALNNIIKT